MLVLLDLDGTLTDPYDGITRSVAHAVARLGLPPLTERQLRSFIGPPLPDQFAALGLRGSEVERAVVLYRETSKPTTFAERIVRHFGLDEHLDLVAGATLDGTRRTKAAVIELTLTTLATDPSDAVMVGDRAQDVVGARAHGMRSIGVTWGYAEPGELEAAHADVVVATPAALVDALVLERGRAGTPAPVRASGPAAP